MIDRIETQQQDHQQYTERKQYKAIGIVSAIPATNRTYLEWVELDKSLPRQEPRTYLQVQSTDVEKCGYHVIHDEGKPTERHEWLLKEHFDNAYRPAENHGNSDDYQQSKPTDDELLNAYSRYMKAHDAIPGDTTSPLTYDEFMDIANIEDWLDGSKDGEPYNRKELDEKFKEKDLRVYTPEYVNSPEYVEYLKSITSYNPTPQPSLGDDATATKAFDWAEWEEYKDDPHHFSPEYKAYVKEQISIFGEIMSPDLFNAGAMLTEKLAGSQGENMKRSVTGSAQASNGDTVTNDISESLKAQFNKIKDTGDKTQLKQEIDRAQAMISLAQAINSFK